MHEDRNIVVATIYDCKDAQENNIHDFLFNPEQRHNMVGCRIILILQQLYHLNVSYVIKKEMDFVNDIIDIYAFPMTVRSKAMQIANPLYAVVLWRFGFILRKSHNSKIFRYHFSKPFTKRTWDFIILIAVVAAMLFFLVRWWEKRLLGDPNECSFTLELLLMVGGYCQHVFPVEPSFSSRRGLYFTFFLYCYIIYTVYTSNLLSHLVNDKDTKMAITDLTQGDFEFVTYQGMKPILTYEYDIRLHEELKAIKVMHVDDALEAVKRNRTAFLSDYTSIYPLVKRQFNDHEISDLVEIDLNSEVTKYIFASKKFKYAEELKLSILKAKETGVLSRQSACSGFKLYKCLNCDQVMLPQQVEITHIISPLILLYGTFIFSTLILVLEKQHYERNRVWPYVE